MSLLVRKIDKAKWLQNDIVSGDDVSADAITNCMKTRNNTLSAWRIESVAEVDEAVLAIVSAHQQLDTIDVVWVSKKQLEADGISIQETPGITPIADLVDHHVDVVDLTYKSLGKVAYCIVNCFSQDNVKRYTRDMLLKLIRSAINAGRLQKDGLAPSIANKL